MSWEFLRTSAWCGILATTILRATCAWSGESPPIPHGQNRPPGSPLSPAEAARKMDVPEGFRVEVVASEPDIVNPVAMTFDERGRIWVTESLEYPRRQGGPGRDRVKVLEDTDGDGKADRFTVFADGLNIPSGIAVGHGGVWVANAPDILFLRDTDGDGKADRRDVVVTGFGRDDTHELPNSLTWGPDGWLYGWNGVFNRSRIHHQGKVFDFTCALFRIHPRTRAFEIFCEGTSNPWGIAWDPEGGAFASACVIDHLWHLVETGYYHRQGGPYPPFTWKIESIVDHGHQKAAYCGIHYFDSDAYPAPFRDKLYMGNIHGNCVNVDTLTRAGATYKGEPAADFLSANDAWFMPVAQKTGPDGSLYILDWYDRYHCYQDANRDPGGIDRLKGRLYRVRYKDTPRVVGFDLARESDAALIGRLSDPNVYFRDLARRLLVERSSPTLRAALEKVALDAAVPRKGRMHAVWALVGGGPLDPSFHEKLLKHDDSGFRAWGVRSAGEMRRVALPIRVLVERLARDESPDVRLQVAIAARKIEGCEPLPVLLEALSRSEEPPIPQIVWQNLHPLLEGRAEEFTRLVSRPGFRTSGPVLSILPRAIERLLARPSSDPTPIVGLVAILAERDDRGHGDAARQALEGLAARIQTGEIAGAPLAALREGLTPIVRKVLAGDPEGPLYFDAALLATSWKDGLGLGAARAVFASADRSPEARLRALDALIASGDRGVLDTAGRVLEDQRAGSSSFRGRLLASLGRLDAPAVADVVLRLYPKMEADLQPKAVELLTQRQAWSLALLKAVGLGQVARDALNVNQVRKLLQSNDPDLVKQVRLRWGTVRDGRNPGREQVIARMRTFLRRQKGDPHSGHLVFKKVCAQCHKLYGEGQDVGPDITVNGRASYDQLLSNVFDPSLVIGSAYQATTVATTNGRILTGLLAEDSSERIVLKMQGGKTETVPRGEVEEMRVSPLSLMPEELEKPLTPQELADLFAFLTLDRPPTDPRARPIPGTKEITPRATTDPAHFAEILDEFAPGFSTDAVGEGGLAIVAEHAGKSQVLRTHPVDRTRPCVLRSTLDVPSGKSTRLVLEIASDSRGDWELVVKVDGKVLVDSIVGKEGPRGTWSRISADLTRFAGRKIVLEIENRANDWSYEFGYWGDIRVISE